ncbi:MAG: hypothetical protein V2I67_01015 [Thermoanaerobaculales bacterium]|jgi:hypothetical protein|nr:hypothetical protein [Thermoanaerobaculales bacterium]
MSTVSVLRFRVLLPIILFVCPTLASADGSIEGTVTFWGDPGGGTQIEISAMESPWTDQIDTTVVGLNDSFSLSVPDGDYYIQANMDRDGGFGDPEPDDVVVLWDSNGDGRWDQVTVDGGTVTGVDIDLGFVYVDIDAAGADDGSSWADAFNDVQNGINLAVSGVDVWVAEGTYVPGVNRSDSFLPKPGVRVYGGFAGVESLRSERDWNANETILSGDIGVIGTHTDNCYHVVRAEGSTPSALLDGITIEHGYAHVGNTVDDQGAGIRARGGGVTLANCTVRDNSALSTGGGAMANLGGTIKAYNSSFIDNSAAGGHGGGYYGNAASAQPQTLINCVFSGNYAYRGGGIALEGTGLAPVLANLTAGGNSAGDLGPGLFTYSTQAYTVHNSIFWGNGPAPVGFWTTAPTINYSIVEGGWAHGGTHILTDDPSFVDAGQGNLRLELDSPAIDAGDNSAVPIDLHDADGNHWTDEPIKRDRDFNNRFRNLPYIPNTGNAAPDEWPVDMGAYEAWDPTLIFEHDFDSGDIDPWTRVVGMP